MTPALAGWALAAAALVVGGLAYGWRGVLLALTMIAFWLLLQFSRTLRVLRNAAQSPVGHVDSAVMFNAKLSAGLRLPQVIAMTRSLGRKVSDEPDVFSWRDGGGDEVELTFANGRCTQWQLRGRGVFGAAAPQPSRPTLTRRHEADGSQTGQHQQVGVRLGNGGKGR
jgi:hypothetical protein